MAVAVNVCVVAVAHAVKAVVVNVCVAAADTADSAVVLLSAAATSVVIAGVLLKHTQMQQTARHLGVGVGGLHPVFFKRVCVCYVCARV